MRKALIALSATCLLACTEAGADEADALCFDFSQPPVKALREPTQFDPPKPGHPFPDTIASGEHAKGGGWATARGRLQLPLSRAIALLRDHTTLKNPDDCDLKFSSEPRPGFLEFQNVEVGIKPFPLVTIRWKEQWAYVVTEGTAEAPRKVLVSYQKTSGTSHIRRFCGNITLAAAGANETDLAIYEETDATRRKPEDIAKGHAGTLRTIRERAAKLPVSP